jgi:lipoic acid synthetase
MCDRKPNWLKVNIADIKSLKEMKSILDELNLHTICESAICPNIGRCYAKRTAAFLILGNVCTRNCKFCAVKKGKPLAVDPKEPKRIAKAVKKLELKHVVVTSVSRDDLKDGGANQFVKTIKEIRHLNSRTTIEILIPDFQGSFDAIYKVVKAKPDIINHNVETVPRLYPKVRPQAIYQRSLKLLETIKILDPSIYSKSGLMLGLGETEEEIFAVMKDLRAVRCDILTLGQYLRPSKYHLEVKEYIKPEKFQEYEKRAYEIDFLYVSSGPLVRSSFNADEIIGTIRKEAM